MNTPTPETDSVWNDKTQNILEHARAMERQRDAWKKEAEKWKESCYRMYNSVACELESDSYGLVKPKDEGKVNKAPGSAIVGWQDSAFTPYNTRSVLATDGEDCFIACYMEGQWHNLQTNEEINSIIAWVELPKPPNVYELQP